MANPRTIAVVDGSANDPRRGALLVQRLREAAPETPPRPGLSWEVHHHQNGLSEGLLDYWLVFLHSGLGATEYVDTIMAAHEALQYRAPDELPVFACYSGGVSLYPPVGAPQMIDEGRRLLLEGRILWISGRPNTPPSPPITAWHLHSFLEATAACFPRLDERLRLALFTGSRLPRPVGTPHPEVASLAHGLKNVLREVQQILEFPHEIADGLASDTPAVEIGPCLRYLDRLARDARRLPPTETLEGVQITSALDVLLVDLGRFCDGEVRVPVVRAHVDALLSWCEDVSRHSENHD